MKKEKKNVLKSLVKIYREGEDGLKPNSWEWVEAIREEIQTDTHNYPWREASEELWEAVTQFQNDEEIGFTREEEGGLTPVEALIHYMEVPRYPPIEVLSTIAEAFAIYLRAEGKLSLEDVFFGDLKRSVGNHSARKAKYEVFQRFELHNQIKLVETYRKNGIAPTLEKLAEEFINNGKEVLHIGDMCETEEEDVESFLRGYRRWKEAGRPLC